MDTVIGNNNQIRQLFGRIAHLSYQVEHFYPLAPLKGKFVPDGEMLACDPQNAAPMGYLFEDAKQFGQSVKADLIALKRAIENHLTSGQSRSINLSAATFSTPELALKLDHLKDENPQLDPSKLWLEITEQDGVPENLNVDALKALKDRGYRLALDDYDINNPKEYARLEAFGPHVEAVKLDHKYAEIFRSGSEEQKAHLGFNIHAMTNIFPEIITVLEGVKGSDAHLFEEMLKAGIKVVQQSGYRADGPVKEIDPKDIELLALHP